MPDSGTDQGSLRGFMPRRTEFSWEQFQEMIASRTHGRRLTTLAEMANMAVFHGLRWGERDDRNNRQLELGEPR